MKGFVISDNICGHQEIITNLEDRSFTKKTCVWTWTWTRDLLHVKPACYRSATVTCYMKVSKVGSLNFLKISRWPLFLSEINNSHTYLEITLKLGILWTKSRLGIIMIGLELSKTIRNDSLINNWYEPLPILKLFQILKTEKITATPCIANFFISDSKILTKKELKKAQVIHDFNSKEFNMILDGGAKAYNKYQVISKDHIHFITTQVPQTHSGQDIGKILVKDALEFCVENRTKFTSSCWYRHRQENAKFLFTFTV